MSDQSIAIMKFQTDKANAISSAQAKGQMDVDAANVGNQMKLQNNKGNIDLQNQSANNQQLGQNNLAIQSSRNTGDLQKQGLANIGNLDYARMNSTGMGPMSYTEDYKGYADAGIIPGEVDPSTADDITINAKKGEYIIPDWAVAHLGVKHLDNQVRKVAHELGIAWTPGPKRNYQPDTLGRMNKPGLDGQGPMPGFAPGGEIRGNGWQMSQVQSVQDRVSASENPIMAVGRRMGDALVSHDGLLTHLTPEAQQRSFEQGVNGSSNVSPSNLVNMTPKQVTSLNAAGKAKEEGSQWQTGNNKTLQNFIQDNPQDTTKQPPPLPPPGIRTTGSGTGYVEMGGRRISLGQDKDGNGIMMEKGKANVNIGKSESSRIDNYNKAVHESWKLAHAKDPQEKETPAVKIALRGIDSGYRRLAALDASDEKAGIGPAGDAKRKVNSIEKEKIHKGILRHEITLDPSLANPGDGGAGNNYMRPDPVPSKANGGALGSGYAMGGRVVDPGSFFVDTPANQGRVSSAASGILNKYGIA